jgi:glutamate formiminotransferase
VISRLSQEQCKNVKLQIPVFLGAEMHKTQNSANTSVFEGKTQFLQCQEKVESRKHKSPCFGNFWKR